VRSILLSLIFRSFSLSASLLPQTTEKNIDIYCNGVLRAKIMPWVVSSASGFSLCTVTRDTTCRLDSSLGKGVLECEEQVWWQRRVFLFGGTYLLLDRNINIHCYENKKKILLLVRNEHRLPSPNSYECLFRLILWYFGGYNSTYHSLHCKH
jgi:hypothetical protein